VRVGGKRKQPCQSEQSAAAPHSDHKKDREVRCKRRAVQRETVLKNATEEMKGSLMKRKRTERLERRQIQRAQELKDATEVMKQTLVERKKEARNRAARENLQNVVIGLLHHPASPAILAQLQNQYASNPERLWSSNSEMFKCSYDDTKNDSLLSVTSRKVGDMIASRSTEGFAAARKAIFTGAIPIEHVDCFLPVTRDTADPYCSDCHGMERNPNPALCRKRSILRLWAGALGAVSPTAVSLSQLSPRCRELFRFFYQVLLPTGLASRYNEVFNCKGQTVGAFMMEQFYAHLGYDERQPRNLHELHPSIRISPALILAAQFPVQSLINLSTDRVRSTSNEMTNTEMVVIDLVQQHQQKQIEQNAKVHMVFDVLKTCGLILSKDNTHLLGQIKSLSPCQIVIACISDDL
jgi:hypothetical protein